MVRDVQSVSLGIQTITTSSVTGQALAELREVLVPGSCAIVLGPPPPPPPPPRPGRACSTHRR